MKRNLAPVQRLTDAVCNHLQDHGLVPHTEYKLPNGQRLDIACIGRNGALCGVEVKMTESDFNRDLKWADVMHYCAIFYFAVPVGFNQTLIHPGIRIITVDGDDARITRRTGRGLLPAHKWHEAHAPYAVKPPLAVSPLRSGPWGDASRARLWVPHSR